MRKTLEKHDIFILRRYLGTTRGHDGTQKFFKKKFDTSALKWRLARIFWIARTWISSKNKRTPNKVTWLYFRDIENPVKWIKVNHQFQSKWIKLNRNRSTWITMNESNWIKVNQTESECLKLNQHESNWIGSNRMKNDGKQWRAMWSNEMQRKTTNRNESKWMKMN